MKWYEFRQTYSSKQHTNTNTYTHTDRYIHVDYMKKRKTLQKVIFHSDEFGINNIKTQIILSNKRKSVGKGKLRERWNVFLKKPTYMEFQLEKWKKKLHIQMFGNLHKPYFMQFAFYLLRNLFQQHKSYETEKNTR